jgi:hypothetical protein
MNVHIIPILNEDERDLEHQNYNCGLNIKTPSIKILSMKQLGDVLMLTECSHIVNLEVLHSISWCTSRIYCTLVLHHVMVANLKYVFVLAGTTKVHYAVLIRFSAEKLTCIYSILSGIYQ